MEDLTGLRAADVMGKDVFDLFPFIKETGNDVLIKKAQSGIIAESSDFEFFIPLTGKKGWVKGIYSPNYDAHGMIIGILAIIHDVTEKKQAGELLRDSEERHRKIYENSPVGMTLSHLITGFSRSTRHGWL